MQLDIRVILTNIIGFVIVVWVLAKFAWKPILDLLDARRARIRDDFAKAETARTEAQTLRGEFESKIGDIKAIERERVQEAVKRGEEIAERIRAEARDKADATLDRGRQDIDVEAHKAQVVLRDEVVTLAVASTEMLLNTKLDPETHRRLVREYIDRLGEMPHA